MKLKVFSLYTLLCLIWGTTWIVLKVSLTGTPPLFGAGLRFTLAGLVLWGIFFYRREKLPRSREAVRLYFMFAVLNFTIGYALTYWATQFIYSNLAAILWAGFPLVVAALAHWALPDDRLSFRKLVSILIGLVGVILIVYEGQELGTEKALVGIGAILVAVLFAAWPNVYLKKHVQAVNSFQLNAVGQSIAGLVLLVLSALVETQQAMVWSPFNIFALFYLSIFGSVFTWLIYVWLFAHLAVTQISYVAFFPPMIATLIGWILLQEALTPAALVGAILVLAGAFLINLKLPRKALEP